MLGAPVAYCGGQWRCSVLGETPATATLFTTNPTSTKFRAQLTDLPINNDPVLTSPRAGHVHWCFLLKLIQHVAFQTCSAYLVGWCRAREAPARPGSTATSRLGSPRATASSLTCRHAECAAPVSRPALTARWSPVMWHCALPDVSEAPCCFLTSTASQPSSTVTVI
jgi:hypothetical protein